MGAFLSSSPPPPTRTVRIIVTNRTENVVLEKPRSYLVSGRCSVPCPPELPPRLLRRLPLPQLRSPGLLGVLLLEAGALVLAVYFHNPAEKQLLSELGLELSPAGSHRGFLQDVCRHVSRRNLGPDTDTAASHRVCLDTCQETARVALGPLRVTATVSDGEDAEVKVILSGRRGHAAERSLREVIEEVKRARLPPETP